MPRALLTYWTSQNKEEIGHAWTPSALLSRLDMQPPSLENLGCNQYPVSDCRAPPRQTQQNPTPKTNDSCMPVQDTCL